MSNETMRGIPYLLVLLLLVIALGGGAAAGILGYIWYTGGFRRSEPVGRRCAGHARSQ